MTPFISTAGDTMDNNQDDSIRLAIVIPAYKAEYLPQALDSLCNQTCKRFNVYVGDDCSKDDIGSIISRYRDKLRLTYKRFDTNLGGTDLTAQWQRCIDMMQGEEFFCLFSDDDIMCPDNIALLYAQWEDDDTSDVYHFDIDIVKSDLSLRRRKRDFPHYLTAAQFFNLLYRNKVEARMPEFIFRRSTFEANGGFVRFDLAFRSDNATVMVNAQRHPICSVKGSRVLWRDSGSNVSSRGNTSLNERRVMASIDFFNWLDIYFAKTCTPCPLPLITRIKTYVRELLLLYPTWTVKDIRGLMARINFFGNDRRMMTIGKIYMARKIFKKRFKI